MKTVQLGTINTESFNEAKSASTGLWSVTGCVDMRIEPFSPKMLKRLREEQGLNSQREFAEVSGIPESTIKKIEAGISKPSIDTMSQLGKFFNLYFYADWEADK